jgi:hypothetical protein
LRRNSITNGIAVVASVVALVADDEEAGASEEAIVNPRI